MSTTTGAMAGYPVQFTLDSLIEVCYEQARILGWTEKEVGVVEQVALIHSEASEALESYRNHEPYFWVDDNGKPQGVLSEYADILIRLGHYLRLIEKDIQLVNPQFILDFEDIVKQKLAYNMTRGYRHGGKAI